MAHCAVFGGNGLIGKPLVNHLVESGHSVLVVDDLSNSDRFDWLPPVAFIQLDATCANACATLVEPMRGVQVVYWLAAHAYEGLSQFCPVMVSNTAIVGTLNVLRAAINCGTVKRFCNVSSMARYGHGAVPAYDHVFDERSVVPRDPPFIEDDHLEWPEDIYGHGKVMAEGCVETLCALHGIEWCHAVPHNVTGPANLRALSDPYRGFMLIACNRLLRGLPLLIFGDGSQKRAPSDVQDVVPALAKMGFCGEAVGQVINLGARREFTINQIAKSVRAAFVRVTGRSDHGVVHEPPRPLEVKNAWCSVEKSVRLLGYADKTSLDEMADRIVRWAYSVAPNGVDPRYLDRFEICAKAPAAWTERRM